MKASKGYMEDVMLKVLYEGISYVEDVIWRMYMEKLYKGDKTLYGRCYMEDVFI